MADVVPNLEDLLAAVPEGAAGDDAATLARVAAAAESWTAAGEDLHAQASTWTLR